MDSLTHIALGALIGEAFAGKKLGKKALLIGALAQSIPDIDFVASFFTSTTSNLLIHRGFTHSILFGVLTTIALAIAMSRRQRTPTLSPVHWFVFFFIEIFTHLILDAFNNYGVGWFEPFSHHRFSFNTLFVADPFFSIWSGVALIVLIVIRENNLKRKYWVSIPIIISVVYLSYALFNKWNINTKVVAQINKQHITYKRFFTTPTAFNNWLWYIVVEDENGYNIAYRSVFDKNDSISFHYFPRKDALLSGIKLNDEIEHLLQFSQGYYIVERIDDALLFNDLRFGQVMGWNDVNAPFVFHYYLEHPEKNILVVQRGRFQGWDKKNVESLITRIKGI